MIGGRNGRPLCLHGRGPRRVLQFVQGGARRESNDRQERDHGVHRTIGMRQDDRAALPQPHERPHPRCARRGQGAVSGHRSVRAGCVGDRSAAAHRHGVPEAESVSKEHLRQRRVRPADQRAARSDQARPGRRALAARCGVVGRGQGSFEELGARPVRRPAATAVHRAHDRGRARCRVDGRAMQRARSDRDGRTSRS